MQPLNPRRLPLRLAECWCPRCTLGHQRYVVIGFPYLELWGEPIIACGPCARDLCRSAEPHFRFDPVGNLCEQYQRRTI